MARRSATKARTQAANQIHSVTVTAPEQVKRQLKGMGLKAMVRVCARWRPGQAQTTVAYAKKTLRHLARRYQALDVEITQLEADIRRLCAEANPALLATEGVGPDTAAVLLVAGGDNPERMKSEKSFAALCGASPVQASSGQIVRHRLNQGGNRQANSALWPMRDHPDANRRGHQRIRDPTPGPRKEEAGDHPLPQAAHRPQIYRLLTNPPPTPNCARLRDQRQHAGITISQAAQALETHPSRISALELGRDHNHQRASRYQDWLRTREVAPPPT